MEERRDVPLKWLWGLFWLHVASCLLPFFENLSVWAVTWYPWIQRVVSLAIAVCLFLLSGRYRLAGMAKILSLLCSIISLVFFRLLYAYGVQLDAEEYDVAINVLSRTATVLGLIALFLEYTAHAQAVPGDSRKWQILLCCSLTVTVISHVAAALLQPRLLELGEVFIRLWNVSVFLLLLTERIIYLLLLYRVIGAQREEEKNYGNP